MHMYPINGACHRVGPNDTAFAYRDATYGMVFLAAWTDPTKDAERIQWVRDYYQALAPYSEPGGYINFMQDDDYDRIQDNYRQNYDRLVQVKRAYDPGNLFHIPVRPGHLGQRAALMPVLAARLAAGFLPQRPRPWRRLIQPLTGRRPRRIPRTLPQPRLKLSDPLPGLRQVLLRPRQRSPRLGQLPAQRRHQRGHHLISGTSIITGHTWTLLPARSSIRRSLITMVPAQHRQMAPRPNLAPVKVAAHMPPGGQRLWLRMAAGKAAALRLTCIMRAGRCR